MRNTIIKMSAPHSPKGEMGQKSLALGVTVSMQLWLFTAVEATCPPAQAPWTRTDREHTFCVVLVPLIEDEHGLA